MDDLFLDISCGSTMVIYPLDNVKKNGKSLLFVGYGVEVFPTLPWTF